MDGLSLTFELPCPTFRFFPATLLDATWRRHLYMLFLLSATRTCRASPPLRSLHTRYIPGSRRAGSRKGTRFSRSLGHCYMHNLHYYPFYACMKIYQLLLIFEPLQHLCNRCQWFLSVCCVMMSNLLYGATSRRPSRSTRLERGR